MSLKAVIFDLDGVIVSTDEYHYLGWQRLADEEGIPFNREINHRLRGISRMGSLEILLERSPRAYSSDEKRALAARKNDYYCRYLTTELAPGHILPGVMTLLSDLRELGLKVAVASSSRNADLILDRIGLNAFFDTVVDGNDIENSKPHPEVFELAARRLGVPPAECLVVEDAAAGVTAALAAGMRVLAVGAAATDSRATHRARSLAELHAADLLRN